MARKAITKLEEKILTKNKYGISRWENSVRLWKTKLGEEKKIWQETMLKTSKRRKYNWENEEKIRQENNTKVKLIDKNIIC